jgi:hypothetical protein
LDNRDRRVNRALARESWSRRLPCLLTLAVGASYWNAAAPIAAMLSPTPMSTLWRAIASAVLGETVARRSYRDPAVGDGKRPARR